MKLFKKIAINVSILFIAILFILLLSFFIKDLSNYTSTYSQEKEKYHEILENPEISNITIDSEKELVNHYRECVVWRSVYTCLDILALTATSFIFVYCNPRLFRKSTWTNISEEWAQNKAERTAAKQAQAEEAKQKQIAELQAKLDELKKDE